MAIKIFQYIKTSILIKLAIILSSIFILSSCQDQGCIEADDFGEYETEVIEVLSNSSQDNCKYDPSAELNDASKQGRDVINCFATSPGPFIDEQGSVFNSTSGCIGLKEQEGSATALQLCIDQCVQTCMMDRSANDSEPNWESTNKKASNMNYGVTVRPGTEISIRAIGNITLGEESVNPPLYVKASSYSPNSHDSNWNERAFDVRNQQSLNIKFSGRMSDGTRTVGAGPNVISSTGDSSTDVELFNGVRRLITYLIQHPPGYNFDPNSVSEKNGAINVPLLSDPLAWGCEFNGSDELESFCESQDDGYTSIGYNNVDDALAKKAFPITSLYKTAGLGIYGGMIRWKDDGIGNIDGNYDPFANANMLPSEGIMVGDLTNSVSITNPTGDRPYMVSFKSMDGANISGCASDLQNNVTYYVVDANNNPIHRYEDTAANTYISYPLSINNSSWTTEEITLEIGHQIKINNSLSNPACGQYIAAKFVPYHEIEIYRSGIAKFAILNASSGSCTINARIINPKGSHSYATFSESNGLVPNSANSAGYYEPDFYEYGTFNENGKDPLESLTVSANWGNNIFVRKGQKIRFSPHSWNGTFLVNNSINTRKCGTAMAIHINPKPALLCRGFSTSANPEMVMNPGCVRDYASSDFTYNDPSTGNEISVKTGNFIGCRDYEDIGCSDADDVNYCPSECTKEINCTDYGKESNNYTKSCSLSSTFPELFDDDNNQITCDTATYDCSLCESERLGSILKSGKIPLPSSTSSTDKLSKCYDLENYTGKVSNINSSTGFSETDFADATISKGAKYVPYFNGSYGNFEEKFRETEETDGSNSVLSTSSPVFFANSGRIKFFILDDNNNFNDSNGIIDSTTDNSPPTSQYNGENGFKISTSGMLNFSNGQWLEVALCQESSNDEESPSVDCKQLGSTDITNIAFSNHPQSPINSEAIIVGIDDDASSPSSQKPHEHSKYRFDDYGNLIRSESAVTGECDIETHGIDTLAGNYFYCHTYQYHTKGDYDALTNDEKSQVNDKIERLRLTFKIHDPEIENCRRSDGSTTASDLDGILEDNSYYDSSDANNTSAICNDAAGEIPGSGDSDCKKEFVCVDKYSNNIGSYLVNIKVKGEPTKGVSNVIGSVIEPIIKIMDGPKRNCSTANSDSDNALFFDGTLDENGDCIIADVGQAEKIYKLLINDIRYKTILNISIILMFTFFGMTYLMGVSELNQTEILGRVIKIGIIYLFVSPTGWDWFNSLFVRFFKGGSDHLAFLMASSFDASPELQNAITNADYYDKSILFSSVDRVFGMLFSDAVFNKIYALLFASIFGWAYLLIVILSFILYVYAVSNAVLLYLTAQIFMSILFTLGPIFFIFILFNQTKEMFDNWLKQLISFSLQQILILTTLAFFNMLMYEVIKMALGYKICWDEVWTINIITRISLLSAWTIASLPPVNNPQTAVGDIGNPDGIPSIFSILFIWVIASLMNKFVGFMSGVASDISGGVSASTLGSGVGQAISQAKSFAKKGASKAWKEVGGQEAMQRLDMTLFDSGKLAEARRDKNNKQNKIDSQRKSKLESGGKKAVEQYKKDNAAKLNDMTEAQRQEVLNQVRNDGIKETGKKMGLNDSDIKRLKDQKGFQKYHGSNVFGAALQASRQTIGGAISGDSTIRTSMGEKQADTSYSSDTFKEAAKNMTPEQRAHMRENMNLDVNRSTTGKAMRAASIAAEKTTNAMSSAYNLRHQHARDEAKKSIKDGFSNLGKSAKDSANYALNSAKEKIYTAKDKASKAAQNVKDLGSSDSQVRKDAAKDIASSLGKAAASPITSMAKAVDYFGRSKEEKIATKELEKEGAINKMADGTNLARPKEEDDLIKERIKRNKLQRNINKKRDIGGAVDAQLDLDHADAQEEASGVYQKSNEYRKRYATPFNKKKDDYRKKAQAQHNKVVDQQISELQGHAQEDMPQTQQENLEKRAQANNNVKNAEKIKKQKEKQRKETNDPNEKYQLQLDIDKQDDIIEQNQQISDDISKRLENYDKSSIGKANNAIASSKEKIAQAQQEKNQGFKMVGDEKKDLDEVDMEELDKTIERESGAIIKNEQEIENHKEKIDKLRKSKYGTPEKSASSNDEKGSDNDPEMPISIEREGGIDDIDLEFVEESDDEDNDDNPEIKTPDDDNNNPENKPSEDQEKLAKIKEDFDQSPDMRAEDNAKKQASAKSKLQERLKNRPKPQQNPVLDNIQENISITPNLSVQETIEQKPLAVEKTTSSNKISIEDSESIGNTGVMNNIDDNASIDNDEMVQEMDILKPEVTTYSPSVEFSDYSEMDNPQNLENTVADKPNISEEVIQDTDILEPKTTKYSGSVEYSEYSEMDKPQNIKNTVASINIDSDEVIQNKPPVLGTSRVKDKVKPSIKVSTESERQKKRREEQKRINEENKRLKERLDNVTHTVPSRTGKDPNDNNKDS